MALQAQSVAVLLAPGNLLPLQNFGTVPVGRNSAAQSFLVSGSGLTANVTVAPPQRLRDSDWQQCLRNYQPFPALHVGHAQRHQG